MSIYVQFIFGGEGLVAFDKDRDAAGNIPRNKIQIPNLSQIIAKSVYVDMESLLVVDFEGGRLYIPTAKKFVSFSAEKDEKYKLFAL